MNNAEIAQAAGLTWMLTNNDISFILDFGPDGELLADTATLFTEDHRALVVLTKTPERIARGGGVWEDFIVDPYWGPVSSEVLSVQALAEVPIVDHLDELDLGRLLDLEADDMRSAS